MVVLFIAFLYIITYKVFTARARYYFKVQRAQQQLISMTVVSLCLAHLCSYLNSLYVSVHTGSLTYSTSAACSLALAICTHKRQRLVQTINRCSDTRDEFRLLRLAGILHGK